MNGNDNKSGVNSFHKEEAQGYKYLLLLSILICAKRKVYFLL